MHEKLPASSFMVRTPCVKLLYDEWPESITPHDVRQTCLTPAWHTRNASCFAQVALCELQCAQVALRKFLWARCSAQTGRFLHAVFAWKKHKEAAGGAGEAPGSCPERLGRHQEAVRSPSARKLSGEVPRHQKAAATSFLKISY